MAVPSESVWAIDIGNCSLKALRLSSEGGGAVVVEFDNIRHSKILSGSGVTEAEREELIALSLRRLVTKHDLGTDEVAVSVPSQNSFARFLSLPPVERRRVPEIVKFEAVQQIPFDIEEVQWSWQRMSEEDSAELKVGIFAIKTDVVNAVLEHFNREDIQVSYIQMAPMALYNYIVHDHPGLVNSNSRATVVLNVGAEITDLVVCTKSAVWQRCILIGGNSFTRAIADTFRLDFEKAEKLKRTAPVSKYARQIFQAMRPVFTDLASEVQRSLGFYRSSNPDTKVTRVVAMGGGTRLRGLLKYLQQSLQLPVERPDSFRRLAIGPGVPAAKFGENVSEFGVVYGLAVQALGLGSIQSNLLPRTMVRSREWMEKSRWFIAAACMLLAVSVLALGRTLYDRMNHAKNSSIRREVAAVLEEARRAEQNMRAAEEKIAAQKAIIDKEFEPFKYREVVPLLHETILSALPNEKNNPRQAGLYEAFRRGDVEAVTRIPRKQRMQLFVTNMSVHFSTDLAKAPFERVGMTYPGSGRMKPGAGEAFDEAMAYRMVGGPYGGELGEYSPFGVPGVPGAGQAVERKSGFVVTVSGYSPYENIEALIDPPGAEGQPSRWGFVTRLAHLVDVNGPFELYGKGDPAHFKLQVGEVEAGTTGGYGYYGGGQEGMPPGIGEWSVRVTTTSPGVQGGYGQEVKEVLVDPMTKEVISKVPELDANGKVKLVRGKPVYQVNDHWFVLNMKFVWKDAPVVEEPGGAGFGPPGYGVPGYEQPGYGPGGRPGYPSVPGGRPISPTIPGRGPQGAIIEE